MNQETASEIGAGLLAHLHLAASEASVALDQRAGAKMLVLYIFDSAASRRVPDISCWRGYPVRTVRGMTIVPH